LEIVLGEAALTDLDRLYVKFADRLESEFIAQGEDENRTIEETLAIGWRLLRMLPRSELKRIRDEYINNTYQRWRANGING